jgi:NADH:ubiquinone oxidoreductase subunit 6 (subunit J)
MMGALLAAAFTGVSVTLLFLSGRRSSVIFWSLASGLGFGVLFLALGSETLAVIQVAITLGITMLLHQTLSILDTPSSEDRRKKDWIVAVCALALWSIGVLVAFQGIDLSTTPRGFESLSQFGLSLSQDHFFDVLTTGILFFVSFIGIGVLARAEKGQNEEDSL